MERKFEGIWIPANLWFRKDLTLSEKMLYLEIKSLDNNFGCKASNKKLGNVIQLIPTSVSRALKVLEDKGLVIITYENYTTFSGRVITLTPCENDKGVCKNDKAPCENDKHSNTISNTISIDNKLSNINSELIKPFTRWLAYKKSKRQKYSGEDSIITAYKKLIRLSAGNFDFAEQIIEEAISNNWSGFFELKNKPVIQSHTERKFVS